MARLRTTLLTLMTVIVGSVFGAQLLQDADAYIDRLLVYKLDPDAIRSNKKVIEAGSDRLPSWMHLDKKASSLKGVPGEKDRGLYIIAVGDDLFAVKVRPYTKNEVADPMSSTEPRLQCKLKDSVTTVKVFLNIDANYLDSFKKSALIEDLSNHLKLNPEHVAIKPADDRDTAQSAALVSGKGNVKRDVSSPVSHLTWIVGCGAVKSHQMDVLEKLEESAKSGLLSRSLGQDVSGWEVGIKKPQIVTSRRLKRQVRVTSTPSPVTEAGAGDGDTGRVTPSAVVSQGSTKESTDSLITELTTLPSSTVSTTTPSFTTEPDLVTLPTPTTIQSASTAKLTSVTTNTPTPSTSITTPPTPDTSSITTPSLVTLPVTLPTESTTAFITHPPTPPPSPTTFLETLDDSTPVTPPSPTPSSTTTTMSSTPTSPAANESTTIKTLPSPPPPTPPPPSMNKAPYRNSDYELSDIILSSGQLTHWTVPAELVVDPDGDDISYSVKEFSSGEDVNAKDTWLSFDSNSNSLSMLPLKDAVGMSKYYLVASDGSEEVKIPISLDVGKQNVENITQFHDMTFDAPMTTKGSHVFDVVTKLQETYGDVVVTDVRESGRQITISFGVREEKKVQCPTDNNKRILDSLRSVKELKLSRVSSSPVQVVSVRSKPVAPCENKPPVVSEDSSITDPLSSITVNGGELLEMKIPDKLFEDEEDIDLSYMTLTLSDEDVKLSKVDWVTLENNTLQGFNWDAKTRQEFQFTLVAKDSGGLEAQFPLGLSIEPTSTNEFNTFVVTIDETYSKVANDIKPQMMIYRKLGQSFSKSIVTVEKMAEGSVKVTFSVREASPPKDDDTICRNAKRYMDAVFTSDDIVTEEFRNSLHPYKVKGVSFTSDKCEGLGPKEWVFVGGPDESRVDDEGLNIIFVIVPIVVVVVIVLVILAIVCVVRHQRKKKQMDVNNDKDRHIEKGVPVVFEDEIKDSDRKEPHETQPLMDETERPAPPAYPQNGKETIPLKSEAATAETYQPPTPPMSEHDDDKVH